MNPHTKFIVRSRAIIVHEGKLLIVKHSPGSDYYALPGGHLEPNETPEKCCEREIFEELGVTPMLGRLLYIHSFKNKGIDDALEFIFEVTNATEFLSQEGLDRTHAFELAEIKWITRDENLNLLPKSVLEDFKAGKIFSDQVRYTQG